MYPAAGGTGLLAKATPAIDIDILVPDAAGAVEQLVRDRFDEHGKILVRIGKAPKRAIPFWTDTPFKKITANLIAPDGLKCQKIEFLGDGQQFVAFGIHPETGKPFEWFGGEPGEVTRDELPAISEAEARALVEDAVELLCTEHGYGPVNSAAGNAGQAAGGTNAPADWQDLIKSILEGDGLHDSLRDLAAKLIAGGMSGAAATNMLRAMMEASGAPRDARWQERYDDIPRTVKSAEQKFAAGGTPAGTEPTPLFPPLPPAEP